MSRHTRRSAPRARRWPHRTLIATGVVLILGVGAWQGYVSWWTHRSTSEGRALVHRFVKANRTLENRAAAAPVVSAPVPRAHRLVACTAPQDSSDPVRGLLEIPALGVVAPVEQGVGDAQLNVAVGHDAYSVWPGEKGNSVLAAHDVSYFASLPRLAVGDTIRYVMPCRTVLFKVHGHAVVKQGSPLYDTANATLTLVTCWPTNALWYTPDRYLVTAVAVGSRATVSAEHSFHVTVASVQVPVPAALAAQGVTLTSYSLPMGTLTLAGTPSRAWAQTTAPLRVETAAVEAYIAGTRALTEKRLAWWHAVAPGAAAPRPLEGAENPTYLSPLQVTIRAHGAVPESVALETVVAVNGGAAPGRYRVSVVATVAHGTLVIARWVMTRL